MNLKTFPKVLVNKILEYDGRIKYRNGIYINQINLKDEKYNLIIKLIHNKINTMQQLIIRSSGTFFINIKLCHNNYNYMYWHDFNRYMIAFYKNPSSLIKYNFVDVYYKFLNLHSNDLPISTFEYI